MLALLFVVAFARGGPGIRGIGASKEEAFEQAGLALTAVITDPVNVSSGTCITIRRYDPDVELLFVQWINALVYGDAEDAVWPLPRGDYGIVSCGRSLGEPVDIARHQPAVR